jgi:Icc-related predicted phosphoesterase
MKLWVVSDLHIEFRRKMGLPSPVPPPAADVLVLAGDIDVGTEGVAWALHTLRDRPVVYVHGNHEYYRHDWHALVDRAREMTEASHVRFLENEAREIDGVRFVGATLWTDFKLFGDEREGESIAACRAFLYDFRKISGLTAEAWKLRHAQSRAFLEDELCGRDNSRTVVVTHHLPSWKSVAARYAQDTTSAGFATDLAALIVETQPALWIHGHTHDSFDYRIGRTRVVCNPAGYPLPTGQLENTAFEPALLVDL